LKPDFKGLGLKPDLIDQLRQKESGRRPFLLAGFAAVLAPRAAQAQADLDSGGLTFRDFAVSDHGSSFSKVDPMIGSGANPTQSRVLAIDNAGGFARIGFDSIKIEVAMPLGWQANEDWERGVGFSADKRYRMIVWRVDFAFEGVNDAEHYAATKAGAIQARKPGSKAQVRKLADGSFVVVYQNVPSEGGPRTVVDLVVPRPGVPKEGVLMTLGMPVSDADRGLKLMALLKQRLHITW
jgi:hypothetical protein